MGARSKRGSGCIIRTKGSGLFIPISLLTEQGSVRMVLDIKAEMQSGKAIVRVGRFRPGTEIFEQGSIIARDIDADGRIDEIVLKKIRPGDPLECVANVKTLSKIQKRLLGMD